MSETTLRSVCVDGELVAVFETQPGGLIYFIEGVTPEVAAVVAWRVVAKRGET